MPTFPLWSITYYTTWYIEVQKTRNVNFDVTGPETRLLTDTLQVGFVDTENIDISRHWFSCRFPIDWQPHGCSENLHRSYFMLGMEPGICVYQYIVLRLLYRKGNKEYSLQ